jgi:hypothetical protein
MLMGRAFVLGNAGLIATVPTETASIQPAMPDSRIAMRPKESLFAVVFEVNQTRRSTQPIST